MTATMAPGPVDAPTRQGSRYGRVALDGELHRIYNTVTRPLHTRVFIAARQCGELVAGCELDEEYTESRLLEAATAMGLTQHEARRTVADGMRRGWENPRQAPKGGTMLRHRTDAILLIIEMQERASVEPWRNGSDPRVLHALHDMALHAGKVRLDASYREIAERAGVGVASVSRAIQRLEGPWLHVVKKGSRNRVKSRTMFQLRLPPARGERLTLEQSGLWPASEPPACSTPGHTTLLSPSHDLWHRRGNAWRIFRAMALHGREVSAVSITHDLMIPRGTVYSNLAWLRDRGLVEQFDGAWVVVDPSTAVAAVEDLHLPPVAQERIERHREDRKMHSKRIAVRAATKGKGDKALVVYSSVWDNARRGPNPLFPRRAARVETERSCP